MKKLFLLAFSACLLFSCSDEINQPKENEPKTTDTTNGYYSPYDLSTPVPIMIIIENHSGVNFLFSPCFHMAYFDGNETDGFHFGIPTASYPNIYNLSGDEYRQQVYGNMETLLPGESRKYCNDPGNAGLPFVPNPSYYTFSMSSTFSSTEVGILQKFGKLFYLKYQFHDPGAIIPYYGGGYLRYDTPFPLGSATYDPQYTGMISPTLYPGFIRYSNLASREVFEDDVIAGSVDSTLLDNGHLLQFKTYANYIHIEIF